MSEGGDRIRVGAVDVGSNSIRLLVADVPRREGAARLVTVARSGEPCRLARGIARTGRIEEAIAERAVVLAAEFVGRARRLGAERLVLGATAALRGAANGTEVAERIAARCGVPVRILPGEEEANLVYESVVLGLGRAALVSACVVFDLGGGSTEVVSGMGARAGRWVSLPIGAVSLTERFLHASPARGSEARALEEHVEEVIREGCAQMPQTTPVLAGVGGTVSAIGVLDREISEYDPARVEGWLVEGQRLERLVERLLASTEAERKGWAILGKGRADIVVAGALVVRLMVRRFRARGLICSTQGLRYGLARQAARDSSPGAGPEPAG